jgi:ribosomal protein S18 acetylase RimI-like enzyme
MDVAQQAHENFIAFNRWRAVNEECDVFDADGVLATAGATDHPAARGGILTRPGASPRPAHDFLMARGNTAIIYPQIDRDEAATAELLELGYQEYAQTPEMVCEAVLPDTPPPDGVTVRLATTLEDAGTYADVAAAAFADLLIPEHETRRSLSKPEALIAPDVIVALGVVDGRVLSGAMVLLRGGHGYVAWVSTLAEGRGRGLGDAVTRRVTNEAFARGAGIVSLEASHFGEAIYARMGYRELYRYRMMLKL